MNYKQYQELIDKLLKNSNPPEPYNDSAYMDYVKLNQTRMKRWDKQLKLSDALLRKLLQISKLQQWIIITEPWCGDAAHIVPFLIKMSEINPLIKYEIQLRDREPFLINNYLTHGSKSIPRLIVRDKDGLDIFNWGPRPAGAQKIMNELKESNADFETIKIALQNWYNKNQGEELCAELTYLF